ncbi:cytosolic carboxypeptidase Nna1-like, partial [Musca vetustissima]|uniref:cytosolic carboxypeptidase Nna1-like n=1 Tax=Musca vetustissima TaxID=27455 RepID=UPI002AB7CE7D
DKSAATQSSNKNQNNYDDSSDSDVSSCESQGSTPDLKSPKRLDKNKHLITKLLTTLEQRSSSNSNEEEEEEEDDDEDEDSDNERDNDEDGGDKSNTWADENPVTQEEIEDIWADKSPEYRAATPTYIRKQFGKDVIAQKYGKFSRSAVGGSKFLTNCHPYNPEEYDGLEFESRFESGNLAKAVQITPAYYELYLRPDLYTSRSRQWFYFRVRKTKRNMLYRFSIVNLIKSDSLYNDGMRPLMYSTHNAKTRNEGWVRCGDNICYYRNDDE